MEHKNSRKLKSASNNGPQLSASLFTQKSMNRRVSFKKAHTNNPLTLKQEKRNRDLVDRARRESSF